MNITASQNPGQVLCEVFIKKGLKEFKQRVNGVEEVENKKSLHSTSKQLINEIKFNPKRRGTSCNIRNS